jgi:hypothetical protein
MKIYGIRCIGQPAGTRGELDAAKPFIGGGRVIDHGLDDNRPRVRRQDTRFAESIKDPTVVVRVAVM